MLEYEAIVDKTRRILELFDKNLHQNIKVALLVGTTGSGKSTLFNLLSGFKFKFGNEENKKILSL